MEISSSGRYVEFDVAKRAKEHAEMCANASAKRQISTLEQQHDELLKAIDRVINGTLLDSAGNRDEDGMISPWADASNIRHWIKILSEAAGKARGGAIMWIDCNSSLPTADDADSNGDVFWLRSDVEMLGSVADGVPVDATHWRPTGRGEA